MLDFESTLVRLPGKIAWPVFYLPASFTETVGTKGRVNVVATVDGAEFRVTVLPSSNGAVPGLQPGHARALRQRPR